VRKLGGETWDGKSSGIGIATAMTSGTMDEECDIESEIRSGIRR
jgi:hypothetical protein